MFMIDTMKIFTTLLIILQLLGKISTEQPETKNVPEENAAPGHILMFHPWNTKSHRILQNALLGGFLARGYTVTGVFPQGSKIKNEKYTEIVVEDG